MTDQLINILARFKIEHSRMEATRNGMFGGPVDEFEVMVPGLLRYMIDDKLATAEEFYKQLSEELSKALNDLIAKEPPLLQCVSCRNTESCAGAMARQWNHGRCAHCGGYFKVVRA